MINCLQTGFPKGLSYPIARFWRFALTLAMLLATFQQMPLINEATMLELTTIHLIQCLDDMGHDDCAAFASEH